MNKLSEEDLKELKKWLTGILKIEKVTVTFTKQDGSERVMTCTNNPIFITTTYDETVHATRNDDDDVCTAYDVELNSWRSFRYESVKRIEFVIGED